MRDSGYFSIFFKALNVLCKRRTSYSFSFPCRYDGVLPIRCSNASFNFDRSLHQSASPSRSSVSRNSRARNWPTSPSRLTSGFCLLRFATRSALSAWPPQCCLAATQRCRCSTSFSRPCAMVCRLHLETRAVSLFSSIACFSSWNSTSHRRFLPNSNSTRRLVG